MQKNKRTTIFGSVANAIAVSIAAGMQSRSDDDTGVIQPKEFTGAVNFKTIGDMGGSSGGTVTVAAKIPQRISENYAGVTSAGSGGEDLAAKSVQAVERTGFKVIRTE